MTTDTTDETPRVLFAGASGSRALNPGTSMLPARVSWSISPILTAESRYAPIGLHQIYLDLSDCRGTTTVLQGARALTEGVRLGHLALDLVHTAELDSTDLALWNLPICQQFEQLRQTRASIADVTRDIRGIRVTFSHPLTTKDGDRFVWHLDGSGQQLQAKVALAAEQLNAFATALQQAHRAVTGHLAQRVTELEQDQEARTTAIQDEVPF